MSSPLAMPGPEREAYLAGIHVGIVAVDRADGEPLVTPVWYRYEPGGDITFVTATTAEKADRLRASGAASFLVQDELPPQRFVSVTGPVRLQESPSPGLRRSIAVRYLPPHAVGPFLAMTPDDALLAVHLTPVHWRSTDFGRLPQL